MRKLVLLYAGRTLDMDFRILIVEDELIVAHHLAAVIRDEGHPNTRIAKTYKEALKLIDEFQPQLILTDIMLGANADGIRLGQHINETLNIPFIYITSHGSIEMIREASKTKPNAYLVKPFKTPDLLAAIELAVNSTIPESKAEAANKIWIKDGNSLIPFNANDILFLQADQNYTYIHTTNNKPKLVRHFLSATQNMLPEGFFIRVHKSYLVNIRQIKEIKTSTVLVGQETVPVGRTYRADLLKVFNGQR